MGEKDILGVTVPDQGWLDLWPDGGAPAGVVVVVWDLTGPPPERAELVVLPYTGGAARAEALAGAAGLRIVQTLTAGYEDVQPHVPQGVTLCTAAGVHDDATAELAVGLAIASLRGLGEAARDAVDGAWRHETWPGLADRNVLLIGAGNVGQAIAERLEPFGVELSLVASRARDGVHGVDELPQLLPRHEVVILATPLNAGTRGLVDAAFLAAMPDGALLVNVSRGPVVRTDPLLAELQRGRLRAALDVTDPEPLPAEHPLWRAPGVLISPHVGGDTQAFPRRARALLREQLERLAAGRELLNVVSR
jgi:phosphoglycerate dehydrogenase-like enzyme